MTTTYIYALCEPGTRTIRYIGKTFNLAARFGAHLKTSVKQRNHLGNWLRSLGGGVPNLMKLCEVPDEEGSTEEIRYIKSARMLGFRLVNATDGGEGMPNPSPETRAKMSAARRGLVKSPETCAKLSASWTPERRAAQAARQTGRSLPLEVREKQAASWTSERKKANSLLMTGDRNPNFGESLSEETKLKMSESWTPERRAAQAARNIATKRGVPQSPESNRKRSATQIGQKRSPEACENMRLAWEKRRAAKGNL